VAHPNRPGGQGLARPPRQYALEGQGTTPDLVSGPPPTASCPGPATRGAPDPRGQYRPGAPHVAAVELTEPRGHQWPVAQGPLHSSLGRAGVDP
jgi:hypothetical protein